MHRSPRSSSWPLLKPYDKHHNDNAVRQPITRGLKKFLRTFCARLAPLHKNTCDLRSHCGMDGCILASPIAAISDSTDISLLKSKTTPDIDANENVRDRKPLCLICWRYHSRFEGCAGAPLPIAQPGNAQSDAGPPPKALGFDQQYIAAGMNNLTGALYLRDMGSMGHGGPRRLSSICTSRDTAQAMAYWNARHQVQGNDEASSVRQTSGMAAMFSDDEMEEWNELVERLAPRDHEGTSYLNQSALPLYAFTLPHRDSFLKPDHHDQPQAFENLATRPGRGDMTDNDEARLAMHMRQPCTHDRQSRDQPESPNGASMMGGPAAMSMAEFEALPLWSDVEDEVPDDGEEVAGIVPSASVSRDATLNISFENQWRIDRENKACNTEDNGRYGPREGLDVASSSSSLSLWFSSDVSYELEYHAVAFGLRAEPGQMLSDGEFDALPAWSDVEDEVLRDERPPSQSSSSSSWRLNDSRSMMVPIMYDAVTGVGGCM